MTTRGLLLDVEGTTTSLRFVHETLYPIAARNIPDYLARRASDGDPFGELQALRAEWSEEAADGTVPTWDDEDPAKSASAYAAWLMSEDRKSTALKTVQGRIWDEAYNTGEVVGHVYGDVLPAFHRWTTRGVEIYIFSSGSVLAQKLLFGHSVSGDLRPFISGYFDTNTGPKRNAESYRSIAAAAGLGADEMLFVSDSPPELAAAAEAGMKTAASLRPENAPLPDGGPYARIDSFDRLDALF